jgi:hypothetical protein
VVVVANSVFMLHAGSHSSLAINSFYRFSSTDGRRNGMSQIFETSKRWASSRPNNNGFAKNIDYVVICGKTLVPTQRLIVTLSQIPVKKILLRTGHAQLGHAVT